MSGSNDTNKKKQQVNKLVGYSAAMGALRSLVGFPIEQPMESVKTQW